MAATSSIRLFGGLSVEVDGRVVTIDHRFTARLIAYLASTSEREATVETVCQNLCDGASAEIAANRMRVSRAIVSQIEALGRPLEWRGDTLRLNLPDLSVDLDEASAIFARVQFAQDVDEELASLQRMLRLVSAPFMANSVGNWERGLAETWRRRTIDASLRIAQIHQESGAHEPAANALEKLLEIEPYHPEAWRQLLRLLAMMDKSKQAFERFQRVQSQLQAEGGAFPASTLAVAEQVRRGDIQPKRAADRFSKAERNLLVGALEHMRANDRAKFLELTAHASFRNQVPRNPLVAMNMVDESMDCEGISVDIQIGAVRTCMTATVSVSAHEEMERYCTYMFEHTDETSSDYLSALSQIAFLRFEQRRMDEAYAHIDRCIALAERYHPDIPGNFRSQRASFDWHMGKFDDALKEYGDTIAVLNSQTDFRSRYNVISATGNCGFIHAILGNDELAFEAFEECVRRAHINGFDSFVPLMSAPYGYCVLKTGRQGGPKLIVDGLLSMYRQRMIRMGEIGVDYAAGALAHLGERAFAHAVIREVERLRKLRQHDYSIAEQLLVDRIRRDYPLDGEPEMTLPEAGLVDLIAAISERMAPFIDRY